jgi:PAS domain S-box-containing protein
MPKVTRHERAAAPVEELTAILASTHDAIIGSTRLGVINRWNPAAAELYGYAAKEIIGQATEVLVPPDRREVEAEILRRIIGGEPAEQYHTARVRKDGSVVEVSITTSAIVTTNTNVGAVMVSRRLREPPYGQDRFQEYGNEHRPQADADKGPLRAQLQQTQRLEVLGRLAGGVAHEFNDLLAMILNNAAFVSEELTAGAESAPDWQRRRQGAQRDVEQIKRAAERATDLTHQLLAFARQEVIQPRVLNLNDVVSEVEELLRRAAGADLELVTSLSDNLWPILADPGQIEHVLVNLAINARDAMPSGGTLRIDTANVVVDAESVAGGSTARPGRHVRLRVSDTGTGMSADVITHAFEPFFTTKGDGSGTGLGLASVYGVVAQAEGTISIKSEPGAGTTFTIMLPVTDEAAAAAIEEPASFQRTPKGATVLIVEDEEALRDMTERIFLRYGYHVITAADGPDALTLAAHHEGEIHLLVTDVVMPKMLGTEVAARLREIRPGIEVLYMSGYAQPVLAPQGRLEPGVALVEKPFSEAALLAKTAQVLNGHFRGFGPSHPASLREKQAPPPRKGHSRNHGR